MNYQNLFIWLIIYHLFFLISCSILNSCLSVFCISFSKIVPIISSPLRSLITYVQGTAFLTFLITKTSSDQFGVYHLAKIFFYFEILTWPPTLNLGSLSLTSFLKSCIIFNINRFHLNCSVVCIIILIYYII